jgi:L-rhamnose-H+ transport protein
LGIALGVAVALGCCAAFGTLVPPLVDGTFGPLLHTKPGRTILAGVFVCLTGIAISGLAGRSKELELSDEEKKVTTREFNFEKGIVVAIFCGILSACMAYGLDAGKPIAAMAKASLLSHGRTDLWQNLPVLIVVLLGGFVTNFVWCMLLNVHNKSGREYWGVTSIPAEDNGASGGDSGNPAAVRRPPLLKNYLFSAVAGVTWYLQFFFYSMGQVKMGSYSYSSWTLHMASIIIFSTLWGIALHEWRGTSKRTHRLIALGLAVLILSTVVIGYGNYLKIAMTGS